MTFTHEMGHILGARRRIKGFLNFVFGLGGGRGEGECPPSFSFPNPPAHGWPPAPGSPAELGRPEIFNLFLVPIRRGIGVYGFVCVSPEFSYTPNSRASLGGLVYMISRGKRTNPYMCVGLP